MTRERVLELLNYNLRNGDFVWRSSGRIAGNITQKGHRTIDIDGKRYLAHRIAWLIHYGVWPEIIHHIDGNKSNNAIKKLCQMTPTQHLASLGLRKDNMVRLKGVSRDKGRFRADIRQAGRTRNLGRFTTAIEAHQAYCAIAERLHGEHFNSGRD